MCGSVKSRVVATVGLGGRHSAALEPLSLPLWAQLSLLSLSLGALFLGALLSLGALSLSLSLGGRCSLWALLSRWALLSLGAALSLALWALLLWRCSLLLSSFRTGGVVGVAGLLDALSPWLARDSQVSLGKPGLDEPG